MVSFSVPMLGFLLLCCLAAGTEATDLKYKDPKQPVGVRIKDLMSRMTLEEKIGQMVQIERSVATSDTMKKYFIGKYQTTFQKNPFKCTINISQQCFWVPTYCSLNVSDLGVFNFQGVF